MSLESAEKCSICGKKLTDFKIIINLKYQGYRRTAADTWEPIENSFISSGEVMCKECFDSFVDTLDKDLNSLKG